MTEKENDIKENCELRSVKGLKNEKSESDGRCGKESEILFFGEKPPSSDVD